jgi:lipoate-protein ligase A
MGLAPNTVRFYQWKPSAVSIGRFQDVSNEVQMDNCRRLGIDIVRRISGGGTVYHDVEGEITYSVIAQEEIFGTKDVVQAYKTIGMALIEAAKILGVNADFNPGDSKNCPNIATQGKKISGSAQFHQGGVILQHGTFLLDTDLKKMFTLLRVPWAKTIPNVVCVAREKLTSIKKELGKTVTTEEAYQALIKGFEKVFQRQLREGELATCEQKLAQELRHDKFSNDEWNLKGKYSLKPKPL